MLVSSGGGGRLHHWTPPCSHGSCSRGCSSCLVQEEPYSVTWIRHVFIMSRPAVFKKKKKKKKLESADLTLMLSRSSWMQLCLLAPEASPILDQPRATSTQRCCSHTVSQYKIDVLCLGPQGELWARDFFLPTTGGDRQFLKMARE